jgi:hypothetical protein
MSADSKGLVPSGSRGRHRVAPWRPLAWGAFVAIWGIGWATLHYLGWTAFLLQCAATFLTAFWSVARR